MHTHKSLWIAYLNHSLMRTIRSIPRATKGDRGIWFFKHQRFVLSLVPVKQLQPFLLGHNRIPRRYVVTLMLNCDTRKHPLPPPHAATRSIISVTHGPICKTRGQQPFVSAWFVYIPVPFPLRCLVCLPLDCWQTVDAPCWGEAESVGVDGQDWTSQHSRFLFPYI